MVQELSSEKLFYKIQNSGGTYNVSLVDVSVEEADPLTLAEHFKRVSECASKQGMPSIKIVLDDLDDWRKVANEHGWKVESIAGAASYLCEGKNIDNFSCSEDGTKVEFVINDPAYS
jgi:hypothetical protein